MNTQKKKCYDYFSRTIERFIKSVVRLHAVTKDETERALHFKCIDILAHLEQLKTVLNIEREALKREDNKNE